MGRHFPKKEHAHTHVRGIGHFELFPVFLCVLFRVLFRAASLPFSDVILPRLLTVCACFVGVWWCGVLIFLLFASIFIYVLRRFCQICTYSLRQRINNGVQVGFCGVWGALGQDIVYTIQQTVVVKYIIYSFVSLCDVRHIGKRAAGSIHPPPFSRHGTGWVTPKQNFFILFSHPQANFLFFPPTSPLIFLFFPPIFLFFPHPNPFSSRFYAVFAHSFRF